jgi:hypothetical protein
VVELACLHLVERDDDRLEEDDVLLPQRNGEAADDTGQDVKQLGSAVEFIILVDESVETIIDCLFTAIWA